MQVPSSRWTYPVRRGVGISLTALVVLAPLAIGTVHEGTRLAVFLACALALAATIVERRAVEQRLPVTVPLLALAVATAATAAQLLPLPRAVVAILSPTALEIRSAAGDAAALMPLTLDSGETLRELAKLGAYLAFFAAASSYLSRSHRRRQMVLAVAGVATVVAAIALVQLAVGEKRVLFFYEPLAEKSRWARGTFVNPNHFGALMCLGAPAALAIGLREPRLRWAAFPAVILINVAVVLSFSRASWVAAALAQALTFALDRWQLRRGSESGSSEARVVLAIAVAAAVAVTLALAAEQVTARLERTQSIELERPFDDPRSKFFQWGRALGLVWMYPWTGVGRGAFEQAFTQVAARGGDNRFPFVENSYLQALVDWGAPVATLLIVLLGWAFVTAIRRIGQDPLAAGAVGALVGLAVHEVADFATELPGVTLPALGLGATLFSSRGPSVGIMRVRPHPAHVGVPAALAVLAIVAAVRPRADEDRTRLLALARDRAVPVETVLVEAKRLRASRPADYLVPAVVAERLARERHPATLKWLNDALYLNPTHAELHLLAAEMLYATGREKQALLEYRLAVENAAIAGEVIDRVTRRFSRLDALFQATPPVPHHLLTLAHCLKQRRRPEDARVVYERVLSLDPENVSALRELVYLALERRDHAAARRHVDRLLEVENTAASRRLSVSAHLLAGELDRAAAVLDDTVDRSEEAFRLALKLANALADRGDFDAARARLDRLLGEPRRALRIELHQARAEVERKAGNEHQRRWELEQAERLRGH